MIEIENLTKDFGKLRALDNITLSFKKGECIALIGPNACGKTTLIKTILGMVIPNSGKIKFNGSYVNGDYEYRSQIGYMPQIGSYPDNMTIGQIIAMMKKIRNHKGTLDEDLFVAYHLNKLADKSMRTLSGGTTQKVSAALAFLFSPDVLILDEPTAGLDPLASEILKEKIISEKQKGKLILITSHLLSELDEIITQIVFIQDGKMCFHKTIAELTNETGENRVSKAIAQVLKQQNT